MALGIHLRLLGVAFCWGISWPLGRVVAQNVEPFTAAAFRFLLASTLLLGWLHWRGALNIKALSPKVWRGLSLGGLLGTFAYSVCFLMALRYMEAGKASVFVSISPAVTVLAAMVVFGERVNRLTLLGMGLCLIGALFALTGGKQSALTTGFHLGLGEWLLVAAMLLWAAYTLINRVLVRDLDPLVATALIFGMGSGLLVLGSLVVEGFTGWQHLFEASATVWICMILLVLLSTVLAYAWYAQGIAALGAGTAAAYTILVPLFGVMSSVIFLGEPLTVGIVLGVCFALGGTWCMNRAKMK
ncbi:MAG: DMT family transporter [Cardiobacteriaceae bacterium]|nr:DMT family transporter [Cardiobacteriaceae bacterium]